MAAASVCNEDGERRRLLLHQRGSSPCTRTHLGHQEGGVEDARGELAPAREDVLGVLAAGWHEGVAVDDLEMEGAVG